MRATRAKMRSVSWHIDWKGLWSAMIPRLEFLTQSLSCGFAAGAVGGVAHYLLLAALAAAGLEVVAQHSVFSVHNMYREIVLGGLWGLLFILRIGKLRNFWGQAIVYGLVPTIWHIIATFLAMRSSKQQPDYQAMATSFAWYAVFNTVGWSIPGFAWFHLLGQEDSVHDDYDRLSEQFSPGALRHALLV